jgi:hypothetical protein
MQLRFEIPESFWSLFRSVNRETYIEALMAINEEYQYFFIISPASFSDNSHGIPSASIPSSA